MNFYLYFLKVDNNEDSQKLVVEVIENEEIKNIKNEKKIDIISNKSPKSNEKEKEINKKEYSESES